MATYKLDPVAFDEHLLNAEWMRAAMHERADEAMAFAVSIAPVYEQGPHPGRYKASFEVESGTHGGAHDNRAWAELRNTSPEALSVEFGTENNIAHHVLTRSLDILPGRQYRRASGTNTPRVG